MDSCAIPCARQMLKRPSEQIQKDRAVISVVYWFALFDSRIATSTGTNYSFLIRINALFVRFRRLNPLSGSNVCPMDVYAPEVVHRQHGPHQEAQSQGVRLCISYNYNSR